MRLRLGHTPGLTRFARAGEGRPRARVRFSALFPFAWALVIPCTAQAELPKNWSKPLDQFIETRANGDVALVLRYLAPGIAREGGNLTYEDVYPAMDGLCAGDGLEAVQKLQKDGQTIDKIVIGVLDRPFARGNAAPDATAFYSSYTPGPEGCVWE